MELLRLNLITPLFYFPAKETDPFMQVGTLKDTLDGEKLYCFDLDESQRLCFEPDRSKLLAHLVFSGIRSEADQSQGKLPLTLPAGNYVFVQKQDILSRDETINLAVELQLEALWQRLEPGSKLYLRYLFEDGHFVTQLFRTIAQWPVEKVL